MPNAKSLMEIQSVIKDPFPHEMIAHQTIGNEILHAAAHE